LNYKKARIAHWDKIAREIVTQNGLGGYYHRRLEGIYKTIVVPGQRVMEIGCGTGELLAALEPIIGLGIDFSSEMLILAKKRHPELHFLQADIQEFENKEKFDVIIFSDLINDIWDVQLAFERIKPLMLPQTRIILNYHSNLWEQPLRLAQRLGLAKSKLPQNWLTTEDVSNLLYLSDFEIIRKWEEILCPLYIPFIGTLLNRYLVKFWPFKLLALSNFILARPKPEPKDEIRKPEVSVIIPVRNEAGNIQQIFSRTPEMGSKTELIFVEGHSKDGSFECIEKAIADNPNRFCKLYRQDGKGKGDAVRLGFKKASGDIFMILDADLTVPPEDLVRFYEIILSNKAEFVNGVRLVYPMQDRAMRFLNLVANKFFSIVFSWLLGQSVKDTLCGTKAISRENYLKIDKNRSYFGDFDPFGDFDLIFGAAKLNLKIIDLPIRYHERTYGTTNINRWRHGYLLFKMVIFAAKKIKFL